MPQPYGYRPLQKYSAEFPFYPFSQNALVASMRSYEVFSPDQMLGDSARAFKLMSYVSAPNAATLDIASLTTTIDRSNPSNAGTLNPLVSPRTVANAGNLPNPTGLDNSNVNRFM